MALLSYDGTGNCGASIFHERWAVTAAHCLKDDKKNPLLTVGTVKNTKNLGFGTNYEIERFYIHPDFTYLPEISNNGNEHVVNDIGLIRVASRIIFNSRVQPIALAMDEQNTYENSIATLSGWGAAVYDEGMHPILRFIKIRVLAMEDCRELWPYADKHICTSNQEHQGVCYGDSGSPLVVGREQIGVTSTTDTFCEASKPDLYTKVASFIPWVKSILSRHGDVLPDS